MASDIVRTFFRFVREIFNVFCIAITFRKVILPRSLSHDKYVCFVVICRSLIDSCVPGRFDSAFFLLFFLRKLLQRNLTADTRAVNRLHRRRQTASGAVIDYLIQVNCIALSWGRCTGIG